MNKGCIFVFFLFFLAFLPGNLFADAPTITVTGAGIANANGEYTLDGTNNSRPKWSNSNGYYIFHFQDWMFMEDYWAIHTNTSPDLFSDNFYGISGNTDQVPPKFGWTKVNSPTDPAPTSVASSQEAVTLSGAGTSGVNERFVWTKVLNSKPAFVDENSAYNLSYSGTDWEIRSGSTEGSGTVQYTNTSDTDTVPTSGWTVSSGSSPAPSGFTNYTLEITEDEFVRINSTSEASDWIVNGGSGEAIHEVIGRNIEYSATPGDRDPSITKSNPGSSTDYAFFGLDLSDFYQITEITLRPYFEIVGGNSFCRKYKINDGSNDSTNANTTCSGNTGATWGGEDVFSSSSNAGSISWPISSGSTVTVGLQSLGGANNTVYYSLINVWVSYTYWQADDSTAPTLSSASSSNVAETTADGTVTTDEGNGTLYAVVTTSSTKPSASQVKTGNDHNGSSATFSGSTSVSSTGSKTFNATGLTTETTYYWHFMHEDASSNQSSVVSSSSFTTGDTTAPTLSSPSASNEAETTADGSVTTNEADGTLYAVVTDSGTTPSKAQVKAGQDDGGSSAAFSDSQSISTTGSKTFNATGLSEGTSYYWYFMHEDSDANQSTVASTTQFSTTNVAPTLSSPGSSNVSGTTADGSVTTNEANGTLYAVVTTSATAPSKAEVKAGQDHNGAAATFSDSQSISTTGSKTFNATGLSELTIYYWHFMHEDAATNQSDISSTLMFTTLDVTNPTISSLSPADNATDVAVDSNLVITFIESVDVESGNITIKKTSDDSTVETIDVTSGQVTGTGTDTITINPSSDLDGETEYYVQIDATAFDDSSSNSFAGILNTTSWSFTTADIAGPTISSISSSASDDGATINWSTNEIASSIIRFGLTSSYGSTTPEINTSPRVTSHSVSLSGLPSCTQYHYQTRSNDAVSNLGSGSDTTFTTTGCSASSVISSTEEAEIATSTGGTLTNGDLTLTVPTNFTNATSTAVFQAHKLDGSTFFAAISDPSGLENINTDVFTLKSFSDITTLITSFEEDLSVTMSYTDDEVSGYTESSLKIYRWDGSDWNELSSCSVDTANNTVTCSTTSFSDFTIFGEAESGSSSSGSSSSTSASTGGVVFGCKDPEANNYDYFSSHKQSLCEYTNPTTQMSGYTFSRNLTVGSVGEDVRNLQKYLNNNGFVLAVSGPGSPGNETNLFGSLTRVALSKYQSSKGITPAIGYFGPLTRASIAVRSVDLPVQVQINQQSTSECFFGHDLQMGDVDEDVRCLQKYLNQNGYTVSDTGPGSPGNETNYFWTKTKEAVIRLQNDNRAEILTPAGLFNGTGYVGPSTRSYLNP